MELCVNMSNEPIQPDWSTFNYDSDVGFISAAMESRFFDFSFLDDDEQDANGHDAEEHTTFTGSSVEDQEVNVIVSSGTTNADDHTSSTSSYSTSCGGCTATTSMRSSILTEPQEHSPTCRCMQLSPFSVSSTLPVSSSSSMMSDFRWPHPHSTPSQWSESNDDYAWCLEAASRVMISVEVHGKLLMRLRDQQQKPRRRYNKKYPTASHPIQPPHGWMSHQQIVQQVPKLLRILVKTSTRYIDQHGLPSRSDGNGNRTFHQTPEQHLRNSVITPLQFMGVLQHVSGVRTMPCHYSNNYYYSIDSTWLSNTLHPKLGYNPSTGNIVLQLVEQRLLYLLDNSPIGKNGRYCTNEIGHIYELTFHEPLLFKPLGYSTFKDLINDLPLLDRVHDNSTCGPNGIQWYIQRSSIEPRYN
jgi:hypothetical protein